MFFDALSEGTVKELYTSLTKMYGKFDYSRSTVKAFLAKYCKDRNIQFDHHCISKVIEKQVIKTDTSYMPISEILSGIYAPSFDGKDETYFGDAAVKQLLNKHKNKRITILIMEAD